VRDALSPLQVPTSGPRSAPAIVVVGGTVVVVVVVVVVVAGGRAVGGGMVGGLGNGRGLGRLPIAANNLVRISVSTLAQFMTSPWPGSTLRCVPANPMAPNPKLVGHPPYVPQVE